MIQIRKHVFETNSSSTHSICVTKKNIGKIKLPEKIMFSPGEFGWEEAILNMTEEKASYFYQAILSTKEEKDIETIINNIYCELNKYGIDSEFEPQTLDKYGFPTGYIDHPYDLSEWINDMLNSTKKLVKFLCSEESFIITGNDNSDTEIDISVDYKHDEYYKGN